MGSFYVNHIYTYMTQVNVIPIGRQRDVLKALTVVISIGSPTTVHNRLSHLHAFWRNNSVETSLLVNCSSIVLKRHFVYY